MPVSALCCGEVGLNALREQEEREHLEYHNIGPCMPGSKDDYDAPLVY